MIDRDHVAQAVSRSREFGWTNALLHMDARAVADEMANACAGPLHGDLFSVKDLLTVAQIPSRAGSLALEGYIPSHDAGVVQQARAAGATFFAKTNCAEFGFGVDTETRLGGRVLHPFRDDLSPGGSSGGDAVAVATRMVDFAIAGDYGGSIRWPAQSVGIFGLRPGVGVLSGRGRIGGLGADRTDPMGLGGAPWQLMAQLEVVGVMARTATKIATVMRALTGPSTNSFVQQRIIVTAAPEIGDVDASVQDMITGLADGLRASGMTVDTADGLFAGAIEAYNILRPALDDQSDIRQLVRGREDLLCPETTAVLDNAPPSPVVTSEVRDAWIAALQLRRRVRAALEGRDAIVMPCGPVGAVGFAECVSVRGTQLSGHELMRHLRAVSLTGLPALSVPMGVGTDGRPVSVQLVGHPGSEQNLCALAERMVSALATSDPVGMAVSEGVG